VSLSLLLVSRDASLREELRSALATMKDRSVAIYWADDPRQAIEIARSRMPQLVVGELTADLRDLAALARDLAAVSPESSLAVAFRSDAFGDLSEAQVLIEAIRVGVKDFLRRPISAGELGQLLDRAASPAVRAPSRQGKVVSFISNKGGVGKSTLALNTAVGLAMRHPGRVLLVDASLQMGVAAAMLDLAPGSTLVDAAREQHRLDETFLRQLAIPHESGLELLAAPATAIDAVEVTDDVISRVLALASRVYDWVVVDTFPVFDRVVVAALDHSDRAYIVLENVVPALLGAAKLLDLLDGLGFPTSRQRLVLNRNSSYAGSLRSSDISLRLGRALDHVLPHDRAVLQSANVGRPYAMNASRWFGFGPPLRRLIDDVADLGSETAVVAPREQPASESTAEAPSMEPVA
jgi:pilus assembly protein CpaE